MNNIVEKSSLLRGRSIFALLSPAIVCAVFFFAFALVGPVAHAYDKSELKITRTIANVRSKPDLKGEVVWVLSPAESFLVGKAQGSWFPVYPASAEKSAAPVGYISRKVVVPAAEDSPLADWGDIRYVGKDLKFYLERTVKSSTGGMIKSGDKIKVGFLKDGWYAIFKADAPVYSEADALGYIKKDDVDIVLDDARIRYAVRKINVIEKPVATSKAVGVLSPGHRAQVGAEKGGMYALYRIDTMVKDDTPVWGYAWGPFLAPYPKNLEKEQMAGIDARKAEIEAEEVRKAKAEVKRGSELAAMEEAMDEMLMAPVKTKTMYATAVLNVRSEPDAKSLIVDKLELGEAVSVGQGEGKWYPVFKPGKDNELKRVGYVFGTYLKAEAPVVEKEKPSKKRKPGGPDEVPIKITSTKMTFSENRNRITFSGKVKVVRLDVTLTSDTLTAHLRPEGDSLSDTQDKIKKIVAAGNVKVVMKKRKGHCDKLTYVVGDSIIYMNGNAELQDGPNLIQGDEIKFYLKDNRAEVVGGNKPIEAIFYTPKNVSP
ncbi:LPS ABC transporter substrate-binding protein LptA [Maridesulfovibrio salexigens]|uniref:Lipopolysaccharide transport periplasmic protein LptA n=1 Tax=Maridesulfovibrio salexigens (strain ATCC 14822 / DSM 2638 / NCIMB 8403 / VKM B-1763) TaxID=526222 RepID=C6BWN3_MARSD|nr:LPS ABC transporter substrate-binding protein LptA [Maridesulfovibrio salexigens]ACS80313.1 lipopolysaccharide transport periplasmic protein LptA [Maridesulfovibrio salexigens DSM 2638]